jgi:hypothetical protein
MTGGPHPSAAGDGRAREAGRLGRWCCWAGLQAVTRGRGEKTGGRGRTSRCWAGGVVSFSFLLSYFYFLFKASKHI